MAAVIPPNVGKSPAPAAVASTAGAVLYDEDPSLPQGHRSDSLVTCRTPPLADGSDRHVRALAEAPEPRLHLTRMLPRKADPALPASHPADLRSTLPRGVGGGRAAALAGVLRSPMDTNHGSPLRDVARK